jgi:DNA-binding transcriptional LysR family regulator
VLGSTDFIESTLLPRLARRVAALAPKVRLVARSLGRDAPELLLAGRLDLLIAPRGGMPSDALTQHLFDDGFVCAVRAGHPKVQKRLSLATFVELSHVLIAPRGEPGGPVERALAERGLSRHVAVETSSFLAAPVLVAETDLVLTGPTRVLEPLAARFGLALFPPPLELGTFPVHQGFHPRAQGDPAHAWLRGLVVEAARPEATVRASRARKG